MESKKKTVDNASSSGIQPVENSRYLSFFLFDLTLFFLGGVNLALTFCCSSSASSLSIGFTKNPCGMGHYFNRGRCKAIDGWRRTLRDLLLLLLPEISGKLLSFLFQLVVVQFER